MKYEEPEMTVVVLKYQDIITGSDGMGSGGTGTDEEVGFGKK